MIDTRSAADRLIDADAELRAAELALAPASAAVDRARDAQAESGESKESRRAVSLAFNEQARRQEAVEQRRAAVRVASRAAAAEQEVAAAAARVAEQERRREEAAKAAVVMRRLRAALEEIRAIDRHPDLPIKRYAAWGDLVLATGRVVASYGWPKPPTSEEGNGR